MVDIGRDVFKLMKNDDFLVLMIQGQIFLKEGGKEGGGLALSKVFSKAIFLSLSFLHVYMYNLLYPLQNCVMHLKKKVFSCHHNVMKKAILKKVV